MRIFLINRGRDSNLRGGRGDLKANLPLPAGRQIWQTSLVIKSAICVCTLPQSIDFFRQNVILTKLAQYIKKIFNEERGMKNDGRTIGEIN